VRAKLLSVTVLCNLFCKCCKPLWGSVLGALHRRSDRAEKCFVSVSVQGWKGGIGQKHL